MLHLLIELAPTGGDTGLGDCATHGTLSCSGTEQLCPQLLTFCCSYSCALGVPTHVPRNDFLDSDDSARGSLVLNRCSILALIHCRAEFLLRCFNQAVSLGRLDCCLLLSIIHYTKIGMAHSPNREMKFF